MCVIYACEYACAHLAYLDWPPVTQCAEMAAASTAEHPVVCGEKVPKWYFSSDGVCQDCSSRCYDMEKRFQDTKNRQAAGESTTALSPLKPLKPAQVIIWRIWRRDREKFRAVGVRGGEGGELGQGWDKSRCIILPGGERGRMKGFPEIYEFDEFLGHMGPFELEGPPLGMLGALEE